MRVIKRYSNRKLYDTQTKKYITLEEIAALIRNDEKCQVVDNKSGQDITTFTLAQIIMENTKKTESYLPLSILETLIQTGCQSIHALHSKLPAPIEKFQQLNEELNNRIQDLIQRGEIQESTGRKLQAILIKYFHSISLHNLINEQALSETFSLLGIPSRKDLVELSEQVEALNKKLNSYIFENNHN